MVGIFSRFSGVRCGHRRTKSALVGGEALPQNTDVGESNPATVSASVSASVSHGIEVAVEFKPVERPVEPLTRDQPVKCPLPEPSILNGLLVSCVRQDGRIWKERLSSAGARVRADLPVVQEGSRLESGASGTEPLSVQPRRVIFPSISAPERNLITWLEECDAAESQSVGE